jgi:signal transduction histidine kinase/integral membrane sensor domain MASE1
LDQRPIVVALAVAASYYLGALLGIELRFPPATTSVLWPPNALLTAALLLTPPRRWTLVILAALPAHVIVEIQAGFPPALIALLFLTNCLEALLAAAVIQRWNDEPTRFDTLQRVAVFVGGAVFLAPLVSTFADAAVVHVFRGEDYDLVFQRRVFSNTLSQLAIVPSVVLLVRYGRRAWERATLARRAEFVAAGLGLAGVAWLVFSGYQRRSGLLPGGAYTALPFLMPLLIYAAVRFGPAGASLSLLGTALFAIGTALSGFSPLSPLPAEERVLALQVFLIVVGVPLLVASALIEERQQGARAVEESLRFEALLSQLAGAFVHLPSHEMHRHFEAWLARVAAHFGVERAALWELAPDGRALVQLADWSAEGLKLPPTSLPRDRFAYAIGLFERQQALVLEDLAALDGRAVNEGSLMRDIGVRSLAALPLLGGTQVLGVLALVATSKPKRWPAELLQNCRLTADVFAGILARRVAEDALRASESMKSAVLSSLTSQVAVLDREGEIIAVNPSWERFGRENGARPGSACGVGANYLQACRRAELAGDLAAADTVAGIEAVLRGARPSFGLEYRCAGGERDLWFQMTALPLDRPEGGAVVTHTDVTERRQAEAEAHRSRDELAHTLRVSTIGELTTSIAHELNQPLAAILANAQAARRLLYEPVTSEAWQDVREIVQDVIEDDKRAGEVIRGLRDLLRKGEGRPQPLDLNALATRVVRLLHNDVMLRGVDLRLDLAEGALVTRGDRVQLQQVLLNLIVNALDALAEVDGERRVRVRSERGPEQRLTLAVEDNGPGLPPEVQATVFQPFFTTKPGGMGMGLSIARSIVAAHGGSLSFDAGLRAGARFSFTLPLIDPPPSSAS